MDEERKYCVYKHTFPSGKVYIGITGLEPSRRWQNGLGYKTQEYFWRAIQKYGWDNISHEILFENLSKEDAESKEVELIAYYQSNKREHGYNIQPGGFTPGKMSEETKHKISEANKGRCFNPITPEFKKFMSERMSGKNNPMYGVHLVRSQESRNKQREKILGENNPFYGKHHSEETKLKMSKMRKGKSKERMWIVVYCAELNKIFRSVSQASDELNILSTCICAACCGRQKTAGGYHWYYVYDQTRRDGTVIQGAVSLGYITEEELECLKC